MRVGACCRALRVVAVTLVALLTVPLVAGCLGGEEDPILAVPTNRPISVPLEKPVTPPPPVNFNDPGYAMEGSWKVGDAWDYASNQSRTIRMRVIDTRVVTSVTLFLLETTRLNAKGEVEGVTKAWVESRTWTRINLTDDRGNLDRYLPGFPLRYYKNGTASLNHTRYDPAGKLVANETIRVQAYLHPRHETIQARFGEYYEARKVEQLTTVLEGGTVRSRSLVTHWVHRAVLNDVAFELDTGERYTLTAYKAAETRRGTLAE